MKFLMFVVVSAVAFSTLAQPQFAGCDGLTGETADKGLCKKPMAVFAATGFGIKMNKVRTAVNLLRPELNAKGINARVEGYMNEDYGLEDDFVSPRQAQTSNGIFVEFFGASRGVFDEKKYTKAYAEIKVIKREGDTETVLYCDGVDFLNVKRMPMMKAFKGLVESMPTCDEIASGNK